MAKSFKGNIAEAFISSARPAESVAADAPSAAKPEAVEPVETKAATGERMTDTTGSAATVAPVPSTIGGNMRLVPETKSKRVHFGLRPSLHTYLIERSKRDGLSVNELLNRIIEEAKNAEGGAR